MQKISGINENKIDKLILDISDYAKEIQKNYYLLEEVIEKVKNNLKGDAGVKFQNYFSTIKQNFKTININILNYKNDLILVKQSYQHNIDKIVTNFNRNSKF